ncbi:MAG: ABC transporter ATP-binding protein [Proteobacteria bacterium]|nr:ABC transporter ATP-binding protein [Pseudomonadota bacterium]MBI3499803.1 ABC transporter ATP-binding protein [Pseudomonadota bacterium]
MSLLAVDGVVAGYGPHDEILKGVAIHAEAGEMVALVGPNGAGKSTLLKTIAGLLKPRQGSVRFKDEDLQALRPREISARGIAFVPQEANVFASLSVNENLEMGGYLEPGQVKRRMAEVYERVPELAAKKVSAARTLSGGQRQMLAMGMALMVAPTLLLLDEPSAGLSPIAAEKLFDTIKSIHQDGMTIVMVEQNALEALAISDRAYILVDGRNNRDGPAKTLAADPEIRRVFLGG